MRTLKKNMNTHEDIIKIADTLAQTLKRVYANNPKNYTNILDLLANGKPISLNDIAVSFGYPALLLKIFFYFKVSRNNFDFDSDGHIIGSGLTLKPTQHHFNIRGNALYTWCAIDTLLFPLMLKESAHVRTPCPITGDEISFTLSPEGILNLKPGSAVISFVVPDAKNATSNIRKSFCQFANAFKNKAAAEKWKQSHPDAMILSANKTFEFTKRVVETLYRERSSTSHYSFFRPNRSKITLGVTGGMILSGFIYLLMQGDYLSANPTPLNVAVSFLLGFVGCYLIKQDKKGLDNDSSKRVLRKIV